MQCRALRSDLYGTGIYGEQLNEEQKANLEILDQFGKACIASRGKFLYLPLMFIKVNLLRRLYISLPGNGKGIRLPCMVSFPDRNQFRREDIFRSQLYEPHTWLRMLARYNVDRSQIKDLWFWTATDKDGNAYLMTISELKSWHNELKRRVKRAPLGKTEKEQLLIQDKFLRGPDDAAKA